MTHPPTVSDTLGSTQWKHLVFSGARSMGIEVTEQQMACICRFAEMLCEWNRRVNLTAITNPKEMAVKHFLDSMAALPYIPEIGRLLDIGSGGGFPGLVLAIFRPSLEIMSIDSVRKKITFQQHLIRTLGLEAARALHMRAESMPAEASGNQYDMIVSRALGSLDMFADLALPLLAEDGTILAYKGGMENRDADEIQALKRKDPNLSIDLHTYCLPISGDRRSLVFIRRG